MQSVIIGASFWDEGLPSIIKHAGDASGAAEASPLGRARVTLHLPIADATGPLAKRRKSIGMAQPVSQRAFFGWRVVGAAFVFAVFAWGIAFYGPSVFLHTIHSHGRAAGRWR
jgi:hypothetical protein